MTTARAAIWPRRRRPQPPRQTSSRPQASPPRSLPPGARARFPGVGRLCKEGGVICPLLGVFEAGRGVSGEGGEAEMATRRSAAAASSVVPSADYYKQTQQHHHASPLISRSIPRPCSDAASVRILCCPPMSVLRVQCLRFRPGARCEAGAGKWHGRLARRGGSCTCSGRSLDRWFLVADVLQSRRRSVRGSCCTLVCRETLCGVIVNCELTFFFLVTSVRRYGHKTGLN